MGICESRLRIFCKTNEVPYGITPGTGAIIGPSPAGRVSYFANDLINIRPIFSVALGS